MGFPQRFDHPALRAVSRLFLPFVLTGSTDANMDGSTSITYEHNRLN